MRGVNKALIFSALQELSSRDEQKRLWLSDGRDGKDVSSFIEANERLFGDSVLDEHLEKGETGFSAEAVELLRQLEAALLGVDVSVDAAELIDSAEMEEVRRLALKALTAVETQEPKPSSTGLPD